MKRTVVMFAKAPVAGRAKTRLAQGIGDELAAQLAAAFIADSSETVGQLDARAVLAWAENESDPAFAAARDLGFEFVPQPVGDLGARLNQVVEAQAAHAETIIVIGSDSPTLTPSHFRDAWDRLETHDVVIGPSFDGGYYLLGVRSDWFLRTRAPVGPHPLFAQVDWSTSDVLGQTLRRCRAVGGLCDLIRFWYDVDTPEDLKLLQTHLLEHLRPSGLDVGRNTAILLSNIPTN